MHESNESLLPLYPRDIYILGDNLGENVEQLTIVTYTQRVEICKKISFLNI